MSPTDLHHYLFKCYLHKKTPWYRECCQALEFLGVMGLIAISEKNGVGYSPKAAGGMGRYVWHDLTFEPKELGEWSGPDKCVSDLVVPHPLDVLAGLKHDLFLSLKRGVCDQFSGMTHRMYLQQLGPDEYLKDQRSRIRYTVATQYTHAPIKYLGTLKDER